MSIEIATKDILMRNKITDLNYQVLTPVFNNIFNHHNSEDTNELRIDIGSAVDFPVHGRVADMIFGIIYDE